jgi:hypothetical protein
LAVINEFKAKRLDFMTKSVLLMSKFAAFATKMPVMTDGYIGPTPQMTSAYPAAEQEKAGGTAPGQDRQVDLLAVRATDRRKQPCRPEECCERIG